MRVFWKIVRGSFILLASILIVPEWISGQELNSDADALYAESLRLLNAEHTEANLKRALGYLERAIKANPTHQGAHASFLLAYRLYHRKIQSVSDVPPLWSQQFTFPVQVVAFREKTSMRVEVSCAIPRAGLIETAGEGMVYLDLGLFLLNADDEITSSFVDRIHRLDPIGEKGLRKDYLMFQHTIQSEPENHTLIGSVRDVKRRSIGTFERPCLFPVPDSILAVSDVLLANRVLPLIDFPEGRDDLEIRPNPLRLYHRPKLIFIYLEIYNLRRDEFGQTAYEISYEVGWPEPEEIDPAEFQALGLFGMPISQGGGRPIDAISKQRNMRKSKKRRPREVGETAITSSYIGQRRNDFIYLQIATNQIPEGIHELSVTVRDRNANEAVERQVLFRISDDERSKTRKQKR